MTAAGEVPTIDKASHGAALQSIVRKLTPAGFTAPERDSGDSLRAQLESARDAYKGEHEQDAALKAHGLVSRLGHKPGRSEDDEEIRGSAYTLLGLINCRAGDQASARRHFAAAAQAFGRLPADRLTATRGSTAADYGITLQRTGDHRGAETALRAAVDLGIDTPDVRRYLGAALRDLGRLTDADEILTDAVARAPHDWQAAEWLADLHESLGNAASTVGADWAEAARLLYKAGLSHRAVTASRRAARSYRQAVREQPDDVRLRITAATVTAQSGARAGAAKLLLATPGPPMDVPTRLDFAELLLELEKDDAAARAFRVALEAEPDNERAAVGLGWALAAVDDDARRDEAERVLTLAVRAHPESVDARALLGEIARVRGRYTEAIGLFDDALARNGETTPASAFLHGSKGQALGALGKTADALEELRRAAEINPSLGWVHRALADLYAESGNLDGQIDELRAVLRLGVEPPELVDLGVALARKAQRLRASGKDADDIASEALGLLDEAGKLLPGDLDLKGMRARVMYRIGREDDAASLLAANIAADPARLDDMAQLAEIERMRGELPAALAHLNQVIAVHPDDAWALSCRAAAHADTGDLEAAERDARCSLAAEPGNLFTLRVLRDSLIRQNRPDDAVDLLRGEVAKENASQELQREYGETLRQAGRLAEARKILDDALWKNPQDVPTRRALGWVLLDMFEPTEALTHFETAARAAPDYPAVRYEEFTARILSGQYEEALENLNSWRDAHPADGEACFLTGWLHLRAGVWQRALTAAREAVRLTPDDAENRYLLGMAVLRAHDDPVSALPEFYEAIRLAPEDPWIRRGQALALWLAGRSDEATAACAELLDMLRSESGEDPEVTALKGWCLGYLGRVDEAVTEYQRALASARWEPSVILFGCALAQLIGSDEDGAALSLDGAWHYLKREPPPRSRGIVAAALADLWAARRLMPSLRESRMVSDAEHSMADYLARLPETGGREGVGTGRSGQLGS